MKLVLSAFPAVGKSTIFKEADERGLKSAHVHFNDFTKEYEITVPSGDGIPVFDSDSSKFDKEFFPTNYVQHIKSTLDQLDDVIILVSSHDNVREMLQSQGIDYILAYPQRELKEEYIRRYKARGNAEGFIAMMEEKWNDFIDSCEADPTPNKIVLGEGEFLGRDYLTTDLAEVAGLENMNDDPEWFHKSLKKAIEESNEKSKPIDFAARLKRMKERRDPLGIEKEGEPVMQYDGVLHFPDGSTASMGDQVAAVRYNNEWDAYLAENPDADVSYIPVEIMGGESMGDILHVPGGGTVDMAQPGWHAEYQTACAKILEERPNAQITATIVDTNAGPEVTDQQTVPTDNPEPTILNTPENTEAATLTAEVVEGGVAAAGPESIAEPVPDATSTAAERDPMVDPDFVEAVEPTEPTRVDLIEAQLEMQDDINVLDNVVSTYNNAGDAAAGMEQFIDGSELLTAAAADINERYKVDIEPTVAGMEGFLDSLKSGLVNLLGKKKDQPTKQQIAMIKKYIHEAEQAFALYSSDKWQAEQKFINVGKTKLQVPNIFEKINGASDIESILKLINKRVTDTADKHFKNDEQRIRSAIKVFNLFKGKPEETPITEVDSHLPIKPELLTGGVKDSGISDVNVKTSTVELPVLNKDGIKEVSKIVDMLLDTRVWFMKKEEGYMDILIPEDDFYESKFWNNHSNAKQTTAVWNAGTAFGDTPEFEKISKEYNDKMLAIAKFLEQWVLASVK